MVLKIEDGTVYKEKIKEFETNVKNPFFKLYHWIKGEIFDIEAILKAI